MISTSNLESEPAGRAAFSIAKKEDCLDCTQWSYPPTNCRPSQFELPGATFQIDHLKDIGIIVVAVVVAELVLAVVVADVAVAVAELSPNDLE